MAAGPKTRKLNGQEPGWTGHVRNVADATAGATITPSNATVYDPPLKLLRIGGAGNIVLVLDANDGDTANHRFTLAVQANEELDKYAVRMVYSTGTTATAILGFR